MLLWRIVCFKSFIWVYFVVHCYNIPHPQQSAYACEQSINAWTRGNQIIRSHSRIQSGMNGMQGTHHLSESVWEKTVWRSSRTAGWGRGWTIATGCEVLKAECHTCRAQWVNKYSQTKTSTGGSDFIFNLDSPSHHPAVAGSQWCSLQAACECHVTSSDERSSRSRLERSPVNMLALCVLCVYGVIVCMCGVIVCVWSDCVCLFVCVETESNQNNYVSLSICVTGVLAYPSPVL